MDTDQRSNTLGIDDFSDSLPIDETQLGTDQRSNTLGIDDFSDGTPIDGVNSPKNGQTSVVINHEEQYLPFDGDAHPATLYQGESCKAVEDGLSQYPCVKYVKGKRGKAIVFNQYSLAAIPFRMDPHATPKMTVTAWIKIPKKGGHGHILSTGGSGGLPHLNLYGNELMISGGRSTINKISHPDILPEMPTEEWVFVAGVWDYEARTLRFHQNEMYSEFRDQRMSLAPELSEVRSEFPKRSPPGSEEENYYVFIGGEGFRSLGANVTGVAIDEVRLFTRALTVDEIQALRTRGAADVDDQEGGSPTDGGELTPTTLPSGDRARVATSKDVLQTSTGSDIGETEQAGGGIFSDSKVPVGGTESIAGSAPIDMRYESDEAAEKAQSDRQAKVDQSPSEPVSSGETTTRVSALEGLRPVPSGERRFSSGVSGFSGDKQEILEGSEFISEFHWDEKFNRPCALQLGMPENVLFYHAWFECHKGLDGSPRIHGEHIVELTDGLIGRIQVCTNSDSTKKDEQGNYLDKRIKGVRLWGDKVRDDGTTYYEPNASAEVLNNCKLWHQSVLCPVDYYATGIVVHANDAGGGDKAEIVGLQLVCRQLEMR